MRELSQVPEGNCLIETYKADFLSLATMLMRRMGIRVGMTLVCLAAACGGDKSVEPYVPPENGDSNGVPDGSVKAKVDAGGCDPDISYAGFVDPLVTNQCVTCHSEALVDGQRSGAPVGIDFDSEPQLVSHAERVLVRAVEDRTMPPGSPLSDCDADRLRMYLAAMSVTACTPNCNDRVCGDDGCGGSCGACNVAELCDETSGNCQLAPCTPDCVGRQCGDDGCGGSCGDCDGSLDCSDAGSCVCVPDCAGRECGDDGCGGSCGACRGKLVCNTRAGQCASNCIPDCTGRQCGDDGCGGTCGTCSGDDSCIAGQCEAVCVPDCASKQCGDDGCGGSCGSCGGAQICQQNQCEFASVSWSADVYPLLVGCGSATCHGGAQPKASLNLSSESTAYAELVSVAADQCDTGQLLVAPGDPEASYLINKLTGVGMCFGSRMPKGSGSLSGGEIDIIRAWIGAGADD